MSLPSSMADFVPCDRLLQKAYTSAIAVHTSKPLDITSSGITLIFWGRAKQTKSKRPYLYKNMGQLSMSTSEMKANMLYNLL